MQIADLVATLRLDSAAYTAGMVKAEAQAKATTSGIKLALGGMGVAAAVAIGASIDEANKFNTMLVHIQSNTGMTTKEVGVMSDGIKQMAMQSGANLKQLGEGFMKIHNFGFSTADSMVILKSAMESALSTGDDVSAVADVMGVAMHEFGIKASDAGAAMNVFHLAAQESNATLGQFATGAVMATNMAATLGVSMVDVEAAISTLVQSGQSVRLASQGVTSMMTGIIRPSIAATAALQTLTHETGVNLTRDFSTLGLRGRGLAGVLDDVRLATQRMGGETAIQQKTMLDYADTLGKNGVSGDKFSIAMTKMAKSIGDPSAAIMSIFPNVRAFREAMLLTTTQAGSFQKHLEDLAAAMSGKVDPTGKAFAIQQQTMSAAMDRLSASVRVIAINIGSVFLPILATMLDRITPVLGAISAWVDGHKQLTAAILGGIAAIGLLGGGLAVISMALGPVAALLAGLSLPVLAVAGAVGLLAYAWTHDFAGIQEKTAALVAFLQPTFEQVTTMVKQVANVFRDIGIAQGLQVAFFQAKVLWGQFTDWWGSSAFPALKATFAKDAPILWGWVKDAVPAALGALAGLAGSLVSWLRDTGIPAVANALAIGARNLWLWIEDATPRVLDQIGHWKDVLVTWVQGPGLAALAKGFSALTGAFSGWVAMINWSKLAADIQNGILGAAGSVGAWMDSTLIPWMHKQIDPHIQRWYDEKHGIKWAKLGADITAGIQNAAVSVNTWMASTLVPWLHTKLDPHIQRWYDDKHGIKWNQLQTDIVNGIQNAAVGVNSWMDSTLVPWLHTNLDPHINRWFNSAHGIQWTQISEDLDTGIWNAMKAAGSAADAAYAYLDTTVNSGIMDAFKGAAGWLKDTGKQVIQGLMDGMAGMVPALESYVRDKVAGVLPGWVRGPLGIKSPSTVFFGIGVDVMQGWINGMQSMTTAVQETATQMAAGITGAFNDALKRGVPAMVKAVQDDAIKPLQDAIHNSFGSFKDAGAALPAALASGMGEGTPKVKAAGKALGEAGPTGTAEGMGVSLTGQEASGKGMILGGKFGKSIEAGLNKESAAAKGVFGAFGSMLAEATTKSMTDSITAGLGTTTSGFFGALVTAGKNAGSAIVSGIADSMSAGLGTANSGLFGALGVLGRQAASTFTTAVGGPVSSGLGVDPLYAQFLSQMSTAGDAQAPAITTIGQKIGKVLVAGLTSAVVTGSAAVAPALAQTLAQTLDSNRGGLSYPHVVYPTDPSQLATWYNGTLGPATPVGNPAAAALSSTVATNTQNTAAATAVITANMTLITKQLQGQVEVGTDLQRQLSAASSLQDLTNIKDQAHAQFQTDIQTAIGQQNMAQYNYLQGQDKALTLDYGLEASQLRQVTAAQSLMDAATRTLATDQQRLQTAQQAYQTAQQTVQTAQQNLDMLTATQAGQDAINKVRQPYDAQHLAQTVQLQKLTSDYNYANISLTQQIQKARQDGNTKLAKQLVDQQQAQTDAYGVQRQQLTDTQQAAADIFNAQMTQLQDQQQAQQQADQLKKAQDALAASKKTEADKKAAVDSAQATVTQAQGAVDKTTAAWKKAAADKTKFDNAAMVAANNDATTTAKLIAQYAQDQLTQITNISAQQTVAFNLRLKQIQTVATALGIAGDVNTAANAPVTPGAALGPTGAPGQPYAGTPVPGVILQPGAKAPIIGGSTVPGNYGYNGPTTAVVPTGGQSSTAAAAGVPGTINITISNGAIQITGSTTGITNATADQTGAAVASAMKKLAQSQLVSTTGAPSKQPGTVG